MGRAPSWHRECKLTVVGEHRVRNPSSTLEGPTLVLFRVKGLDVFHQGSNEGGIGLHVCWNVLVRIGLPHASKVREVRGDNGLGDTGPQAVKCFLSHTHKFHRLATESVSTKVLGKVEEVEAALCASFPREGV